MLNKEQQVKYLKNRIGSPVIFKYPAGENNLKGTILDRVVCFSGEDDNVIYWNLIDHIRFAGDKRDWLRLTYVRYRKKVGEISINYYTKQGKEISYKKEGNRWVFAGQTSLTEPFENIQKLFSTAINEKDWFRQLFESIKPN